MNKLDESENVIRNKIRLVTQDYTEIEWIDFKVTFAFLARLEAIWMILAFTSFKDFKLFKMDVKSTFLNAFINEEVYVDQPLGFVDPTHPKFVFKLEKVLYGLKQTPGAWYERLRTFLVLNNFVKGKVDTTLFTKHVDNDF